jgi:hypothetical protein
MVLFLIISLKTKEDSSSSEAGTLCFEPITYTFILTNTNPPNKQC